MATKKIQVWLDYVSAGRDDAKWCVSLAHADGREIETISVHRTQSAAERKGRKLAKERGLDYVVLDEHGNVVEREAAPEPVDFEALGKKFGETMREEYIDEFDEDPDRETIGDWDSAALEGVDRADKKLIKAARDPQVAWCEFQDGFNAAFYAE